MTHPHVRRVERNGDLYEAHADDRVVAVDATLAVRWISESIAIDGITWAGQEGTCLMLAAEMDPPGGWLRVVLDASTGREVDRGHA